MICALLQRQRQTLFRDGCHVLIIRASGLLEKKMKYLYVFLQTEIHERKKMFYLMMHSTHFIYGYMASDIWYMTIQIAREETRCCHMGHSFRLAARVVLYVPSHRQDSTYHGLWYTSHGALAGTRNSSMGPP